MNEEKEVNKKDDFNKIKTDLNKNLQSTGIGKEELESKFKTSNSDSQLYVNEINFSSCQGQNEFEKCDENLKKDLHFSNVPVKLSLEKHKNIDSAILPSAESRSSENYQNSIKALNKLLAKKQKKRKSRCLAEPTKVSQSNLTSLSSWKSLEDKLSPFSSSHDSDSSLDQKLSSKNLKLAFKATLNNDIDAKQDFYVDFSAKHISNLSLETKSDHWNIKADFSFKIKPNTNSN